MAAVEQHEFSEATRCAQFRPGERLSRGLSLNVEGLAAMLLEGAG